MAWFESKWRLSYNPLLGAHRNLAIVHVAYKINDSSVTSTLMQCLSRYGILQWQYRLSCRVHVHVHVHACCISTWLFTFSCTCTCKLYYMYTCTCTCRSDKLYMHTCTCTFVPVVGQVYLWVCLKLPLWLQPLGLWGERQRQPRGCSWSTAHQPTLATSGGERGGCVGVAKSELIQWWALFRIQ